VAPFFTDTDLIRRRQFTWIGVIFAGRFLAY
jgi:hypothetical protein